MAALRSAFNLGSYDAELAAVLNNDDVGINAGNADAVSLEESAFNAKGVVHGEVATAGAATAGLQSTLDTKTAASDLILTAKD